MRTKEYYLLLIFTIAPCSFFCQNIRHDFHRKLRTTPPVSGSQTVTTQATVTLPIQNPEILKGNELVSSQNQLAQPAFDNSLLKPQDAPLGFASPSIRAFQQDKLTQPIMQQQVISGPLTPLQAPLQYISPSIRAFPYSPSLAEDFTGTPYSYSFSGYIKNEAFVDSYQVIGERQDHYLFFPGAPHYDRSCSNIKAKGRFDMLVIETRLRAEVAGPYIFGAGSHGIFEADAWASSALQIGLMRIRHAFIYFEWEDKSLLMGQYWHPLLLPECYADTISFNGGTPIEPFTREPQVRLTKQFDTISLILAVCSHANTPYDGPYGIDTLYPRNAILPNINIQLLSSIKQHICGIGVDITRIVPRLVTNKNIQYTESLMSFITIAFAAFNWENLALRTKFIYAQNGNPYGLISGYAVDKIDPYTDKRHYTNTQCLNGWVDVVYKGEVEPGLFMGVSKNIGASHKIIPSTIDPKTGTQERLIYADGFENIDFVYRISPRIRWFLKPFIFGAELEITGARYGSITQTARVVDAKLVNNVRTLLAAYYVF
jgi:hypothetical protein